MIKKEKKQKSKRKKDILITLGVILFSCGVTIWFLFSYLPDRMEESAFAIEKMEQVETQMNEKEPHYCLIKGAFLMPVMLVSGENDVCKKEKNETKSFKVKEVDITSSNSDGNTYFYCTLITENEELDIGTGFYMEPAKGVCSYFETGKEYHLSYSSISEEKEIYPISVKK